MWVLLRGNLCKNAPAIQPLGPFDRDFQRFEGYWEGHPTLPLRYLFTRGQERREHVRQQMTSYSVENAW